MPKNIYTIETYHPNTASGVNKCVVRADNPSEILKELSNYAYTIHEKGRVYSDIEEMYYDVHKKVNFDISKLDILEISKDFDVSDITLEISLLYEETLDENEKILSL